MECLESIRKIDYQNFNTIVVDNGSTDDSVRVIQQKFPEIDVLETGENLGYAGGNNYGIRYALKGNADYILLLNNDVVVHPQLIKKFIEATLIVSQWAIFAAKIYYFTEPKKIWYAGTKRIKSTAYFMHIGQGNIDFENQFNVLKETDYACGCAIFFYKGVIDKIGLFDEKFFLTYEEADFCYRARKIGIRSYVVPGAKIWHKISISFGGKESALFRYFITRNKLLWAEKNLPFFQRLSIYIRAVKEFLDLLLSPVCLSIYETILFKSKNFSSVKKLRESIFKSYNDPIRRAKILGLRDYFLRRFGSGQRSIKLILK